VQISDQIVQADPNLVAVRPLLEAASSSVVASPSITPVVRSTIAPLHRALVSGESDHVLLRVADVGAVLVSAIRTLAPDSKAVVPEDLGVTLSSIGSQEFTADIVAFARSVTVLSWLLPILSVLCLLGAGMVGGGGRLAWVNVGRRGLVWSAVTLAYLTLVVGIVIALGDTETLAGALALATFTELETSIWWAVGGLTLAALLIALVNRPDLRLHPREILAAAGRWAQSTELSPGNRLVRALLVVSLGVALIIRPITVVSFAATIAGIFIVLLSIGELWSALVSWITGHAPTLGSKLKPAAARTAMFGTAVAVLVALIVIGAWPTTKTLPAVATSATNECNGYAALCERPYNQVAFAATHNSMSAADGPGWFLAEQPTGVMGQLRDGIRVFLIDSWPGQETDRPGVIANADTTGDAGMIEARQAFGAEAVDSALRLQGALNLTPHGPVESYLCHSLCELGATRWTPLMQQVKTWMDANPREVLTFFVQDEVSPADTAKVFEAAGLMPFIHNQKADQPWPTLGEMISSGKRLVVLHEKKTDPSVPWILAGNAFVQDTPYDFKKAADFSCAVNRGAKDAPLFLVNHWLSNFSSRITDAEAVNVRSVLLTRLQKCRTERKMIPNYVAVDNYDKGDLVASVNALNGVG